MNRKISSTFKIIQFNLLQKLFPSWNMKHCQTQTKESPSIVRQQKNKIHSTFMFEILFLSTSWNYLRVLTAKDVWGENISQRFLRLKVCFNFLLLCNSSTNFSCLVVNSMNFCIEKIIIEISSLSSSSVECWLLECKVNFKVLLFKMMWVDECEPIHWVFKLKDNTVDEKI